MASSSCSHVYAEGDKQKLLTRTCRNAGTSWTIFWDHLQEKIRISTEAAGVLKIYERALDVNDRFRLCGGRDEGQVEKDWRSAFERIKIQYQQTEPARDVIAVNIDTRSINVARSPEENGIPDLFGRMFDTIKSYQNDETEKKLEAEESKSRREAEPAPSSRKRPATSSYFSRAFTFSDSDEENVPAEKKSKTC